MPHRRGRRAKSAQTTVQRNAEQQTSDQVEEPERVAMPCLIKQPYVVKTQLSKKLLQHFYDQVKPLEDYVPTSCNLLQDDDPIEYVGFVQDLVIGAPADRELEVEAVRAVESDMKDIIEQAQARLFRVQAKIYAKSKKERPHDYITDTPKNVICLGYRPPKIWRNDRIAVHAGAGVALAEVAPNSIVADMKSSALWERLLSRIGTYAMLQLLATPEVGVFFKLRNECLMQLAGTNVADTKIREVSPTGAQKAKRSGSDLKDSPPRKRRRKRSPVDQGVGSQDDRLRQSQSAGTIGLQVVKVALCPPRALPLGASRSAPDLTYPRSPGPPIATSRRLGESASTSNMLEVAQPGAIQTVPAKRQAPAMKDKPSTRRKMDVISSPNDVVLLRHRMYHAQPSKVGIGRTAKLVYDLPESHILKRLPQLFPHQAPVVNGVVDKGYGEARLRHLAKYVFPRQFGLHNPFTFRKAHSSWEILPDYDDRELAIKLLGTLKTPDRLKPVIPLLERMLVLHSRCNYRKLLEQHCATKMPKKKNGKAKGGGENSQSQISFSLEMPSQLPRTQVSGGDVSLDTSNRSLVVPHGAEAAAAKVKAKPKVTDFVCSPAEVESFVLAVVAQVIPRAFWGSKANFECIKTHIVSFLRLRRFESMTVHTFMQNFSIQDCDWLRPVSASRERNLKQKASVQEMAKRTELLADFLYWFIDGFVISLVKTAFYITDSAQHQNRALFFRQDDWRAITGPLLNTLGRTTFEKIPASKIHGILAGRELGFSYVRLLPKVYGVRPIVNLARRPLIRLGNGRKEVGKTINKILQNAFDVLTFERKRRPELVGSLVLSPQEIYAKLKQFKKAIADESGQVSSKLYFVKVDVQACYDTIVQEKLLAVTEQVLIENEYFIRRYSQVTSVDSRPAKQFKCKAFPAGSTTDQRRFFDFADGLSEELHNVILADQVVYLTTKRDDVMRLLREHITTNLVKINSKLYRQKDGIPQGSVLSSMLCSLFYGDMEKTALAFTKDPDSLMLRYVDDFLFISKRRDLATQFLRTMNDGIPEYGCSISAEKRLANFDVALTSGELVVPFKNPGDFPWCGLTINTQTLDVKASTSTHVETEIADKLTVQHHRKPGQSFLNAMLRAVKIRAHIIYTDTSHNSRNVVYLNMYQAMLVVALKFQAYVTEWGADPRKRPVYFLQAIRAIIKYQYTLVQSRQRARAAKLHGAECRVKKSWVLWLGFHAFKRVLSQGSGVYEHILKDISGYLSVPEMRSPAQYLVRTVTSEASNSFVESVFEKTLGQS